MKTNVKRMLALVLCLVMVLALAACGSSSGGNAEPATEAAAAAAPAAENAPADAPAAEEPAAEAPADDGQPKVLNVGTYDHAGGFNPFGQSNTWIGYYLVYEGLQVENGTEVNNQLMESMEWNDDYSELTIQLKDGVFFSNGEKLDGYDVLWTWQTNVANHFQSYYECIDFDNCTVSDDGLTLTLRFNKVFGPFTSQLRLSGSPILNKEACEGWEMSDDRWWDQPVGTGPYKVVENVNGSHTTYELRDDYWDAENMPYYDVINVYYYSDQTALFVAYQNGEIDMAFQLSSEDTERCMRGEIENTEYAIVGANAPLMMCFDPRVEAFLDDNVRKAMVHACDFNAIANVAYGVLYNPVDSTLTPAYGDTYLSVGSYDYDLDLAKEEMAASGYPDGFEINVVSMTDTSSQRMYEMLQSYWSQIGITMNVQYFDGATAIPMFMNGETDLLTLTVMGGNATLEPNYCYSTLNNRAAFPASVIMDEEWNEHYNQAQQTFDKAERDEAYHWMQQWLHDNYQCVPMFDQAYSYCYNSAKLTGCDFTSTIYVNLRDVAPAA